MSLDQIRARVEAATGGPWESHQAFGCWVIQSDACDEIATIPDRPGIDDDPLAEANAAAIINAHYDRRDLLAAVDAVLALADYWATLAPGDQYYADKIRTTITRALDTK